jgi:NAD(P)-dependent dehydrogenase (short-subunit alcohol dehydrogenase family)
MQWSFLKASMTFVIFIMVQMNAISLTNKVSLVTGASGGIGRVIAASLAAAGSLVAIGYRNHEQEARDVLSGCGDNAMIVQGDVSDPAQCRRIVDMVVKRYGRVDILVNNAAIGMADSFEMPYETWLTQWSATLNANLMSAVNMTFCCVPHMKNNGSGKVINISSRSAFRGETEYMAYAASKAAMVNFTRCVARTLARDNIQAYAVAPGFIEVGMGLEGIARHGDEIRAQVPSGKIGTAQDVANVVLFLASDLSDYLTGSTIDVNGGSYLH